MSRFVAELLDRLFPPEVQTIPQPHKPFLVEPLVRSDNFILRYQNWLADHSEGMLRCLHEDLIRLDSGSAPLLLSRHCYAASEGVLIDASFLSMESADFLLEHFKRQLESAGYRAQQADRKYNERAGQVEIRSRYYMKPDISFTEQGPVPQLYGNIQLELIQDNRTPRCVKVQANTYLDQRFSAPLTFSSLLTHVVLQPYR